MNLNIKTLWQDKFVRGTFLLTAVSFLASIFSFLVHPLVTRYLTVPEYGDFQALLSFLAIFGIVGGVIGTTLTKEFSVLANQDLGELNGLRKKTIKILFFGGLLLFGLVAIFSQILSSFFKISSQLVLIVASVGFLYSFLVTVNRSALTGLQKFEALSINSFLDSFCRFLLVIIFVAVLPYKLFGASLALGFSGVVAFVFSFWQIKKLNLPEVINSATKVAVKSLWKYASLVLWFTVLSQFFYNFDMLLVKAFFSATEAGFYGALLTIGRIVFFIGGSVPLVMFPVIASLRDDVSPRKYKVLAKSLGLMSILAIPTAIFIAIFPKFVIKIIVGSQYLSLVQYLPIFVWVIFFLTLMTVLAQYFLALAKKSGLVVLSFGAVMEILALSFFHHNLWQIISSLLVVFGGVCLVLLLICLREYLTVKRDYVEKK